jgi:hypothetical protein
MDIVQRWMKMWLLLGLKNFVSSLQANLGFSQIIYSVGGVW